MQCSRCQAENREGRRFCGECGAALALVCPACNFSNEGGEKYCGGCGAPLGATPAPVTAQLSLEPQSRSPQTYTPQHLAERILASRAALQDERKQVTVLFADLKGSMELLADRDPEEARAILDPVLERMMEAVHRYEGTVNQVMGDGIMALFGAPLAHEDHAVRACYAALRMQEAVKQYAQEVLRAHGAPLHIRVGLNSGEVVVRAISTDLHMDYSAIGQTTHLAARMEQMAQPGSILLTPDTLRLVEGYVQVKGLGPIPIKGLDEPVEVYELLGAGTVRSRLQAAAARGLTKFVGRDAELATLRRTLEQAGAGHGQVVALIGEPGVGKSRLVWEFSHSHRTQGWLVLQSASVSYGKAISYLPIIDLLRGYFGIEARDDVRRIRERLTGKLLTLDPALGPTLPAFLALLDVPTEDPAWEALDPPQRRERTLDAVKHLVLRESQEQPLLLVFEDLHWIDTETQTLLDSLVESLPTARILLLVNYRPEYEHPWHRKTYYQQLRLDPLLPESADALLVALLGDPAGLRPLKRALIERTEGNPFFLEESVRTLVESGVLAGERGAYRLTGPFETALVPASVQAVLAGRIDRLPPEDKRLLQAAAVIGKDVPYPLLQAIAELPDDALRQRLAHLHAAEFLYETSLFPDLEYTFKHALTHAVAYGSLLHERRRTVHTRIVVAIERLYPDRLAEQVERLAHHAFRGEGWDKAVSYLRRAGAKAALRSAHQEAVAYYEQALEALGRLPESQATLEQAIDLRLDLRRSLQPLGESGRVRDYLVQAETIARTLGDQVRLGELTVAMSVASQWSGEYERAVEYAECALGIARSLGSLPLQVEATSRLGQAYLRLGQYRQASDILGQNLEILQGDLRRERFGQIGYPVVICSAFIVQALAERGEFAEAVRLADDVIRQAEAFDQPWSLTIACWSVGYLYLRAGRLEEAIPLLQRAVGVCEASHIAFLFPAGAALLGYAYALAGRSGEAISLLEQAVEQATTKMVWIWHALCRAWLSEAYLLSGRRGDASDLAAHALALAGQHKEQGGEAWTLRLLGEIAAHADPPEIEQAEAHFRQALALAEELEMRPLVAHCHRGLGTLYQKASRHDQARAALTTAAELYAAMEMTFWLTGARADLEPKASAP